MLNDKVILGFETSCDETAIAIMKDNKLLVNKISSQVDIHEKIWGSRSGSCISSSFRDDT